MNSAIIVAAVLATGANAATTDSCVLMDFTTMKLEFTALNAMLESLSPSNFFDFKMGKENDSLILHNIPTKPFIDSSKGFEFRYDTTIDSIQANGLQAFVARKILALKPNTVALEIASSTTLKVKASTTTHFQSPNVTSIDTVQFSVEKPTFVAEIDIDMFACAPEVSAVDCSNLTVEEIQTKLDKATTVQHFASLMKAILMRFQSAKVKDLTFDFESVSDYSEASESSNARVNAAVEGVSKLSANEINEDEEASSNFVAMLRFYSPTVFNAMIAKTFEPMFGATCLLET
ncbi:uncharacterized protein CCR75_009755 [Bremia lactucae]|uniref:Uncharacterized protein n=1 Tax=Bremia lactucae TaxID=4779 RepID=A0A976IEV2_BRELC|nr:hypothetical protein CCR75_009755 [Bremia lactucae]